MSDKARKTDAWMPLWIGDYLADTMGLTRDEHGAYLLLLFAYWRNKGPLKNDEKSLASIVKSSPLEWRKKLSKKMGDFFEVQDGFLVHARADKELKKAGIFAMKAHDRAVKAAAARWSAKSTETQVLQASSEHASSNAQAMLNPCPSPSPSPSPSIGIPTVVAKEDNQDTHTARVPEPAKAAATARGLIAMAIRATGMSDLNTTHPTFTALIDRGVTAEEFQGAAREAVAKGKGFGYMLAIVTGRRKEAAAIGTLPTGKPNPMLDPDSRERIEADGVALGLGKWEALDSASGKTTPWPVYAARVKAKRGDTPPAAGNITALVAKGLSSMGA